MPKQDGVARIGRLIDRATAQAQYRTGLIAPTVSDMVCLRVNPGAMEQGALHIKVMLRPQEAAIAARVARNP
jgi:hypothetical protein